MSERGPHLVEVLRPPPPPPPPPPPHGRHEEREEHLDGPCKQRKQRSATQRVCNARSWPGVPSTTVVWRLSALSSRK